MHFINLGLYSSCILNISVKRCDIKWPIVTTPATDVRDVATAGTLLTTDVSSEESARAMMILRQAGAYAAIRTVPATLFPLIAETDSGRNFPIRAGSAAKIFIAPDAPDRKPSCTQTQKNTQP